MYLNEVHVRETEERFQTQDVTTVRCLSNKENID